MNIIYSCALFTYWLSRTVNAERRRRRRKRKLNKLLLGRGCIPRPRVCLLSTHRRVAVTGNSVMESDVGFSRRRKKNNAFATWRVAGESRPPDAAVFFSFFTAGVGNGWGRWPSVSHLCLRCPGWVGSGWVILPRRLEWIRSLSNTGAGNHSVLKWRVALPSLWLCLQMTHVGVVMSAHVKKKKRRKKKRKIA